MILQANAFKIPLADKSVQCCVTSPPYWALRDYGTATWEGGDDGCEHKQEAPKERDFYDGHGTDGKSCTSWAQRDMTVWSGNTCRHCGAKRTDNQLGLESTPEEYIENMVQVFREVKRVLRDDAVLWMNMGDSYVSSPTGNMNNTYQFRNSKSYNRGKGTGWVDGLKPKDLCMMPARLAMALQAGFSQCQNCGLELRTDLWPIWNGHKTCITCRWVDKNIIVQSEQGWWLRSMMPFVKRSAMPESCTDRPASALEYVFLLTKSSKYFFDMDAIRKQPKAESLQRYDYGLHHSAPKDGYNKAGSDTGAFNSDRMGDHMNPAGRNFRNTDLFYQSLEEPHGMIFMGDEMVGLDVNPYAYKESHFATFPPKLIVPLIKAGTSEGGCCVVCSSPLERVVEPSKEHAMRRKSFRVMRFDGDEIGDYIKRGLEQKQMTQSQLAEHFPSNTGGKTGCVHNWITGKNIPTSGQWANIKGILDLGDRFDLLLDNPATGELSGWEPLVKDPSQVLMRAGDTISAASKTIGWEPTCKHKAETKPCVVFDPFGGSGTVKDVAERLGRKAIVMDLSYEYCQLAKKRCVNDQVSLELT